MKTTRVGLVTKEWPPQVYGGAGVHAVQLTEALRNLDGVLVDVHCFGGARDDGSFGYETPASFETANPAVQAIATDLVIANNLLNVDVIHSHTWYANMAGHFGALLHGVPHVITAHSLEPLRPWKADQLGGGYQISSWAEKSAYESADAIIAVSDGMRADVLAAYPSVDPTKVVTIRNGVDVDRFKPTANPALLTELGITGHYAIFVGRITRQKGLAHLLRAWQNVPAEYGLVLAAGSPDEETIGNEVKALIEELQKTRPNVIWIPDMLPHEKLCALLTSADLFICPSIYEPLGIVNLEAMACETAVLATRVGGIPEVVSDGNTGKLVNYSGDGALIAKSAKAILAGGPAAKAGMKAGDIITSIDGRAITSPEELIVAIRAKNVGDSIKVTFKRGSEIKTATLTLTAAK